MAESRGGKEDMRLKRSFQKLWEQGTQLLEPGQFGERFTGKHLKVKTKTNNIPGLHLADLLATFDNVLCDGFDEFAKQVTRRKDVSKIRIVLE